MVAINIPPRPKYQCCFEKHPEGYFVCGPLRYQPCWTIGFSKDRVSEEVEEMARATMSVVERFYRKTDLYPREIIVNRFRNGKIQIIIDEREGIPS